MDEIGDIPRNVQSKLLRTLETRTIERVGSKQSIPVDFRLISATNVDLEQAMKDGDFRSDLYYRLCTITIVLPPLRERKEDLPELIRFFLKKYGAEQEKEMKEPDAEVWDALLAYNYKGNIRELKNVIERLVVLSEDGTVSLEDLPDQFFEKKDASKGILQWKLLERGAHAGGKRINFRSIADAAMQNKGNGRTFGHQ